MRRNPAEISPAGVVAGAVLVAVLGGAAPLTAGWTQIGPEGGAIRAIAAGSGVVYAATAYAGVFRSDDNGSHWLPASAGLPPAGVFSVAVLPGDESHPAVVFAGVVSVQEGNYVASLFRSVDGGRTWLPNRELPEGPEFAGSPGLPRVLYAFSFAYASEGSLIYRTLDGGESWQGLPTPSSWQRVEVLAVDPVNPSTLYAAVIPNSIVKSTDGGVSWAVVQGDAVFADTYVAAMVFDPAAPGTLLAVTHDGGVFATTDGGATWKLLGRPSTFYTFDYFVAGADGTLYLGDVIQIFTSTDQGATWSPAAVFADVGPRGTGGPAGVEFVISSLAADPRSPRGLYVATDHGIFHSGDGGGSWHYANRGLIATAVEAFVVDPTNSAILYVSVDGRGLLKSVDGGMSWRPANTGLTLNAVPTSLAIDPQRPNVLYAAGNFFGLARSIDGAATWQYASLDYDCGNEQVVVAASSPRTVYSQGCSGSGMYFECSFNKSNDRGATWTCESFPGIPGTLTVDPTDPDVIYLAGDPIRKSTDGGRTWRSVGPPDLRIAGPVVVDPTAPETVYAPGYAEVDKSTDGGRHWRSFRTGLPQPTPDNESSLSLTVLAIDPVRPATLFTGAPSPELFEGIGIFKSADAGVTWSPFSRGLPRDALSGPLVVDPRTRTVYAGTTGFGLYAFIPAKP